MDLYFLRHGIAVEPGAEGVKRDSDRPLTDEGRRKLREVARAMRALELDFDVILTSPYVRARQTAELVAEHLQPARRLGLCEALASGGSPGAVLASVAALKPVPRRLLLVGHEPDLSGLISWLLTGATALPVEMKKAGLCKVSAAFPPRPRGGTLEWLLTPRLMRTMR